MKNKISYTWSILIFIFLAMVWIMPACYAWPVSLGESVTISSFSPAIGDVNGDGLPEIVVGTSNGLIYCLDKTGATIWTYNTGSSQDISITPLITDLDGDGSVEILFVSGNYLYCLQSDDDDLDSFAQLKCSFSVGGTIRSSPAAVDIDGDNMKEVFFGSEDGYLYGLKLNKDTNGSFYLINLPNWPYSGYAVDYMVSYSSPAVADINADGKPEVIFGMRTRGSSTRGQLVVLNIDGTLYGIYYSKLQPLQAWVEGWVEAGPIIVDLDKNDVDNKPQILFFGSGSLYCLSATDEVDPAKKFELKFFNKMQVSQFGIDWPPAIADLNNDGVLEIVGNYWKYDGTNRCYKEDLVSIYRDDNNIWQKKEWLYSLKSYSNYNHSFNSPIITDLDADSQQEILFGAYDGYFYCLNEIIENGVRIYPLKWRYGPILGSDGQTPVEIHSSPALGDLDGDGNLEVVFSHGNQIFVLDNKKVEENNAGVDFAPSEQLVQADRFPWPMFGGNLTHTSSYLVPPLPPRVDAASPSNGVSKPGEAVDITTTYGDANGYDDIASVFILINSKIDTKNCFYGRYDPATNMLYIRPDVGSSGGWIGGKELGLGENEFIENSYVKLNCSASKVEKSGNTIKIAWNVTFTDKFSGTKNVYLYARDKSGAIDGWNDKGNWTISSFPETDAASPSNGVSKPGEAVNITTTYSDPNGYVDISVANILVNDKINTARCFYGYYNRQANTLYLKNEAGTGWIGGYAPGSDHKINNTYASLDCRQTTVSGEGSALTITWNVTFSPVDPENPDASPKFLGAKNIYLYVRDKTGAIDGWNDKGNWTINSPPQCGMVTPLNNTSQNAEAVNFTATFTDTDASDIASVYILFSNTFSNTQSVNTTSCFYGRYDLPCTNKFSIKEGSSWVGGGAPGLSDTIGNSYVTLDYSQSEFSVKDKNAIAVTWSVSFTPEFLGTKYIYLFARDKAGMISGWKYMGIWTIIE